MPRISPKLQYAGNVTEIKPGLGIEIKMNIYINLSINVINVLNIDINFNIVWRQQVASVLPP